MTRDDRGSLWELERKLEVEVANAVADALSPLGAEVTELPLTPERVWRAIDGQAKEVEETHG